MANEVEFSFLEPQDLMTKTTYDSNTDNVVEVAQDIDGFDTAADNTFYGKVGGVTGFFTVPSGAQAINDLTDVDTTGITIGQVLQYDGSGFVPLTITDQVGATILNELGDVDTSTTAPTNGDALVFDGTNFVPQAVSGGGASVISDLTDVDTTGVALNNVLKYDGTNWVDGTIAYSEVTGTPTLATVATSGSYNDLSDQPTIPVNINDLGDVDTTGITSGQVLQYNGTNFIAATVSAGGASVISDLTDVDITGVALNNVLKYDGTNWVDGSIAYSEVTGTPTLATVATSGAYSDLSGTPTLSTVATSGSYNDLTNRPSLSVVATTGDYTNLINTPTIPSVLDNLGDVDTTTTAPTNGDALIFDGTNFVPQAVSGGSGATQLDELTDVTISTPVDNQFLRYNGTNFVNETVNIVSAASDLTDVDTSGAASGNLLKYNGTTWVSGTVDYSEVSSTPSLATVATTGAYSDLSGAPTLSTVATSGSYDDLLNQPTIPSNIEELGNVDTTGVVANNILKYNGTNWVDGSVDYTEVSNTPTLATVATTGSYDDLSNLPVLSTVATSGSYTDLVNTPSIPASINDLSDVDTSGITNGQVLQFDGTSFVAATISGGSASTLNDLTDVDTATSAPTTGDTLVYNGTEWVPQAPAAGGSSNMSWERVELMYDPGFDQMNGNIQNIVYESDNVTATIVDGNNSVVEFTFTGKSYPPLSITTYGRADSTGEWIINSLYAGAVTRVVTDDGVGATSELFNGNFTGSIRLSLDKSSTNASGDDGFTYGSRCAVLFAFGG